MIDGAHELPDLVVISGRNGAGKTHLLQALRDSGSYVVAVVAEGGAEATLAPTEFKEMPPGYAPGMPTIPGMESANRAQLLPQFKERVANAVHSIRISHMNDMPHSLLARNLEGSGLITPHALAKAEAKAGKEIQHWTDEDFDLFSPLELTITSPFSLSLDNHFRTYSDQLVRNDFRRWRAAVDRTIDGGVLSEEEFNARYGPKPWELLTEAMTVLGLPYAFDAPTYFPGDVGAPVRLRSTLSRAVIPLDGLSSGEAYLLQIAKSAFSFSHRSDSIIMPQLLLMDEPDATLHPSMIRSLLRLIQELFVERHGIRVIMTTHSPTTVALAPDSSLYVMERRDSPTLRPAQSKDEALSHLLVGVPTMSVNYDNRRVVLTESKKDASKYQSMAALLEPLLSSERSLTFMPAGGDKATNSCDVVIDMVTQLRKNGNLNVWGLVDRDGRTSPIPHVFFNNERYTIENFILDPLSLGFLMLREKDPSVIEIMESTRYTDADPSIYGQRLVNFVTERMGFTSASSENAEVTYVGGFTVRLDSSWLETKGHDLHDQVLARFPKLNSFRQNLEETIVEKVWDDRVDIIPQSVLETFRRLLA